MFDPTRLSVILFAVLRVGVLTLSIFLLLRAITRYGQLQKKRQRAPLSDGPFVRLLVGSLAVFVVWLALLSYNETVYRPKTVLRPVNPALEERLQEVDSAPEPTPVPKPTPTPTFEEQAAKNRRDNAEARKAFDDVAPDRK